MQVVGGDDKEGGLTVSDKQIAFVFSQKRQSSLCTGELTVVRVLGRGQGENMEPKLQ